jgi:DHA2 family multidrug resistance protein
MTRWLAGRYGRKAVYQFSIAVFALGLMLDTLATTSIQFVFARIVQGAASGPLGRCRWRSCSMCCRRRAMPGSAWRGRCAGCSASAAAQHRRLAQRISRLALDLLFQPADGGLHLPGDGAVAPREEGREQNPPFDFFGLATFSLGMIGLQMLLDRGERLEWFASAEIWAKRSPRCWDSISSSCTS